MRFNFSRKKKRFKKKNRTYWCGTRQIEHEEAPLRFGSVVSNEEDVNEPDRDCARAKDETQTHRDEVERVLAQR